jgi:hypothetical protein
VSGRLDVDGLVRLLDEVEGRPFLGAVYGGDCLELVFGGEGGGNLLSVYLAGRRAGTVVLGGVAEPESYARSCKRWRPWGVRP